MLSIWLIAFGFGVVAGLRTFTAPAILLLARHLRVAGIVVAALAIFELYMDLRPTTPSRTTPVPLLARLVSGAFCGAFVVPGPSLTRVIGALVGVAGALVGTYGGHAARLRLIAVTGAIPAAVIEDVVAIGLALGMASVG